MVAPRARGVGLIALATLLLPLLGITLAALAMPGAPDSVPPAVPTVEPTPLAAPAPPPTAVLPRAAPTPVPSNPFPAWQREQSVSVLLLGVDRRPDEQLFRTDTIILANIDLRAQRAALISIPRDLLVNIPGYGYDRVNSAYALGEVERPGNGVRLLRSTIERNFGVAIEHYVLVDFNCFRGAVDAIGGVTVDVPAKIYDPTYPTDDYGTKLVVFEPGRQWMDGERALEYVRTRYGDTDFGRMRRQQQFLLALRDQALQIRNLGALPQVLRACSGMASDLGVFDLVALGAAARQIQPSAVALHVIDERLAIPTTAPSGAAVLQPRWPEIRALIRSTFGAVAASAETVR